MRIILEKEKCIGCGSCAAVCSKYFEMMIDDGKSHLKNSKINPTTKIEELEIVQEECAKEAVDICPVQCIRIEK